MSNCFKFASFFSTFMPIWLLSLWLMCVFLWKCFVASFFIVQNPLPYFIYYALQPLIITMTHSSIQSMSTDMHIFIVACIVSFHYTPYISSLFAIYHNERNMLFGLFSRFFYIYLCHERLDNNNQFSIEIVVAFNIEWMKIILSKLNELWINLLWMFLSWILILSSCERVIFTAIIISLLVRAQNKQI